MRKKIGIMGGTFDPIHVGHLILGETAYEQHQLDQVWFMPSGNPPHKRNRAGRAFDEQRVAMVNMAIAGNSHFALSLEDMQPDGYSYTYLLLERLIAKNPDTDFYFIIGGDSLFDFETWREPAKICQTATLLVAGRNQVSKQQFNDQMDYLARKYNGTFLPLDVPNLDISSNMLRQWTLEGKSIRYYVPDSVGEYIKEQQLYL